MVTFGYVIPGFGPFTERSTFVDLLQTGEGLGFDDVWFGDHVVVPEYAAALTHPDWLEPLTACFVGLAHTTTLRFGTDVLVAPYRHPVLVAKMVATADHLTGGRLTLGVGVGYLRGEFATLGVPFAERGAITDEFLEVVRVLWERDGATSYDGRRVHFDDAVFGPRPVQRPIPVWVGGNVRPALRRAALLGDGWHPLFPTPAEYAVGRAAILALRGDDSRPFTFSYSCATTVLLDRPPTSFTTGSWGEDGAIPDDFSYAPPLPTDVDGRPLCLGTPDQVAADLQRLVDAGVEHVTLRFANGSPEVGPRELVAQMGRFMDEVAPRFRP